MAAEPKKIDPVRARQAARGLLDEIAVLEGVISELRTIADDKERELFAAEQRIKVIFGVLGLPFGDGLFDRHAAARLLAESTGKDGSDGG